MSRILHVDPTALRAVAASAVALLPDLSSPGLDSADLDALARRRGGAALVAEHERLVTAVARAAHELAELTASLTDAAAAAEAAERSAMQSIAVAQR